jgi:hypothetical protein
MRNHVRSSGHAGVEDLEARTAKFT